MQGNPFSPYGPSYAGASPLQPLMTPRIASGPAPPFFSASGSHVGVDQVVHQPQPQWAIRPEHHYQSPAFWAPTPLSWGTRRNGNPQSTALSSQPASDYLQSLVKDIKETHPPQWWCSYELKKQISAAASKIEQLKEITQRIQQLSGHHWETEDHGRSVKEVTARYSGPSACDGSTSGSANALEGAHFKLTEAAKQVEKKNLDSAKPTLLDQTERAKELSLAEATAKVLRASIEELLKPLHHLRTGEGTRAETVAWKNWETRQKKIQQYRARRKKRRRQVAEKLREEREAFSSADTAADEWRAQRTAHDIAQTRLQLMGKAANAEAQARKRRLEQDVTNLLLLERLEKLRALRIAKLRRQGHMFPEEDDNFMARVQESAKQEAAEATAGPGALNEDPQKITAPGFEGDSKAERSLRLEEESAQAHSTEFTRGGDNGASGKSGTSRHVESELRKYYFESSTDMGRLVEVRRAWDMFVVANGSAIPGHWVEPPDPPGPLWAQFLERTET